ncbi:MAG: SdrD B-like domain-containing protein, partial [Planctomycetota bacterium]
ATATDNCSDLVGAPTYSDSTAGDSCETIITRTWTATDACGNSASCDQIITVVDDDPPTIECPQPPAGKDCISIPCNTPEVFMATAEDNCSSVIITFAVIGMDPPGCAVVTPLGGGLVEVTLSGPLCEVTIEATASDGCGCEGTIGDKVWLDENGDGCQDPEEPGLQGVTVMLYEDCVDPVFVAETTTDADGLYSFGNLCDGEYLVVFQTPDGLTETVPNIECVSGDPNASDEFDSDAENGEVCVTLDGDDDVDLTIDCGFICTGIIGDLVWHDLNEDGCQNPDEPGLEGVTVTLYQDCVVPVFVAETTTDADGLYEFTDLCAGDYLVTFQTPDGYMETTPNVECLLGDPDGSDAIDSDVEGGEICVTLPFGDTVDDSNDCGFYEPLGGEGCTPGYWKQEHHFCNWPAPYEPGQPFSMWFDDAFAGKPLLTVMSQSASSAPGPNQLNSLGRHAVAALLNAASSDVAYDLSPEDVIEMFNEVYPGNNGAYNGLKAIFSGYNEQVCLLGNCNDDDGDDGNVPEWGTAGPSRPPTIRPSDDGGDDGGDDGNVPGWGTEGSSGPPTMNPGDDGGDDGNVPEWGPEGSGGPPMMYLNDGELSPGAFGGILELNGDFAQTADGVLHIEVTGLNPIDGYDVLSVEGEATLNGVLLLDFIDGFEPQIGDRFEVLHARSITGQFLLLTRTSLGDGRSVEAAYEPQTVAVEVVPGPDSCPADVTADRVVDNIDLLQLVRSWGTSCGAGCPEDLDGDGAVGLADLLRVVGYWGFCSP